MQTTREKHFRLDESDKLSICRLQNSVNLTNHDAMEIFNIEFLPCHLPEIRELVLELETLQQRLFAKGLSGCSAPVA